MLKIQLRTNTVKCKKQLPVLYCPHVANEYADLEIKSLNVLFTRAIFYSAVRRPQSYCFQDIRVKRQPTQWQRNTLIYIQGGQKKLGHVKQQTIAWNINSEHSGFSIWVRRRP